MKKLKTWQIVLIVIGGLFWSLVVIGIIGNTLGGGDTESDTTSSSTSLFASDASTTSESSVTSELSAAPSETESNPQTTSAPSTSSKPTTSSAPATSTAAETSSIPTTSTAPANKIIGQTSYTFSRNQDATISIVGTPGVEYTIKVTYPSGTVSSANGLEKKTSGSDGAVSWTWQIGGKTNPGEGTIKISGGGETFTAKLIIS